MASDAVYSAPDSMLKKRDEVEDVLEERRRCSDLRFALRRYAPVSYGGPTPCGAEQLKGLVLQSEQLRYVTRQVCRDTGASLDEVQAQAAAILEEMAQRLQLRTVRCFAFTLSKIFKRMFRNICVNEEGLQRLQQAVQDHPVVLLPSHRSYMDFLLMSYILYSYDLALPVIAAGMDFLGMTLVGEMLRMSGAFFIRRSFGGDRLYWAVFSQYVQTMLKMGFAPVEFFLEGTRSRTSKSLTPKLGLLNIVLEPFLKGEVFDIFLVPVSISYERILEEALYARELLGVPKPRESTSGLFRARKVLGEDFGDIHVYFGQPLSVRRFAQGRVDRRQFNLLPRHIPRRHGDDVQRLVKDLAYRVLRAQEENMVLKPWVLMACLLLQNQAQNQNQAGPPPQQGVPLDQLTQQALWLRDLSRQFGAFLHWPDQVPPPDVVSSSLSLHAGLVRISEGRVHLALEPGGAAEPGPPHGAVSPQQEEQRLLGRAVVLLSCASYRNQLMHVFIRPALLASAVTSTCSTQKGEIFAAFCFLRNIFSNEFVLRPGAEVQDFEEACFLLVRTGVLLLTQQQVLVPDGGRRTLVFLTRLLDPFLQGYQVVCRFLCDSSSASLSETNFVSSVQKFVLQLLLSGSLSHTEVLSSDLQKNALAALTRLGAVGRVPGGAEPGLGAEPGMLRVNRVMVSALEDALGGKLPTQNAAAARL